MTSGSGLSLTLPMWPARQPLQMRNRSEAGVWDGLLPAAARAGTGLAQLPPELWVTDTDAA